LFITAGFAGNVCNTLLHLFTIDEAILMTSQRACYPKFAVKLEIAAVPEPRHWAWELA
jgi:hypothetical protein